MPNWKLMLRDRVIRDSRIEEGQGLVFGRGREADVTIDNPAVSRTHVRLTLTEGAYSLTDLGSTNGSFVNGARAEGTVGVTEEDLIEFGKFRLVLDPPASGDAPHAAPADFDSTVYIGPAAAAGPATGPKPALLRLVRGRATPSDLPLGGKAFITVGKASYCDVKVPGWFLAGSQCSLLLKDGTYYLAHQAGMRRTTLNGVPVRGESKVRRGDTIGVGRTRLRLE